MKAAPADQRRLLDVAELDTRMRRADHERRNPPHAARIAELAKERQAIARDVAARLGERDDLRAELSRIEADVSVVDARIARDGQRLATTSSPKDAQGLESELASLARRKSDLEDGELEVMERLERIEATVAELDAEIAVREAENTGLDAESRVGTAAASTRYVAAERDRAALLEALPAPLIAFYERASLRGVGAALLRAGTCEGCRMMLPGSDLAAIRHAASDEVVTCPECECILLRTEESGL